MTVITNVSPHSRSTLYPVQRHAGLLVVFVFRGGLFHTFSKGLPEVFLHPPCYLLVARVFVGTVDHT
ncbi:hypothetical protein HSEST_0824 [Halapricum desulfuricans]|uniref:Uncharacterized protein n=1 Tax=Halapricum desulfuricans TaxID=2841257 RepID=A0A897NNQ5_9EURY|nr:hypothetical protein HSEST_0824 [Halapricum desulfuricans]